MEKGRLGQLSDHAGRNASERRAGPETLNAEADPPVTRERLPPAGKRTTRAPDGSAGVVAAARMEMGNGSNTGSLVGGVHRPTGTPRGAGRAGRVPSCCRLLRADDGKRRRDALPRDARPSFRSRLGSPSRRRGARPWSAAYGRCRRMRRTGGGGSAANAGDVISLRVEFQRARASIGHREPGWTDRR